MLKISDVSTGKKTTILQLEGRVIGPWVEELSQICEPLMSNNGKLSLDLTEVSFVDEKAMLLLASLRSRGVKLLRATPFVEEQLRSAAPVLIS